MFNATYATRGTAAKAALRPRSVPTAATGTRNPYLID